MSFKKVQIGKQKSGIKKFIPFLISLLAVFFVFSLGLIFIESTKGLKFSFFDSFNLNVNNIGNLGFGTEEKKINILLVGRGGGNHDAPNLTDSIILVGIDTKQEIVSMLSIPRDLLIQLDNSKTRAKINEIYSRNLNTKGTNKSEAIGALETKITQITGQKIDYYINVDFEGFKQIVDLIGGIEVTVDETLVDYEYPDGRLGYTTFILKKGTWILDGETALKYARSRHSTSDFDRSLRQQKILSAIKDKIIKEGYLSNPGKIKQMFSIAQEYIDTDLGIKSIIDLVGISRDINTFFSFNLNDSCSYGTICYKGGFLYVPSREYFGGLSVLIPQGNNYTNIEDYAFIKKYANLIFNFGKIYSENTEIYIYNSTKITNLARTFASGLFKYGFNIPDNSTGNTKGDVYPKTTIFYNNIDENSATLQALQHILPVTMQKVEKPKYSDKIDTKIEIIIGDDYKDYENKF